MQSYELKESAHTDTHSFVADDFLPADVQTAEVNLQCIYLLCHMQI